LASITITAASDFAVGEFGIAQAMATGSSCAAAPIEVIAAADLAVDKTGPATVTAGDLLTYTITVHNNGPADALNVVLTDTLPYGVLPFSPLTYTLGTIAAGDAITVEVVAQSDPNACYQGKVNNYVEVSSDTPDLDPTNNNDEWGTVILSQADLLIAKEALAASVTAGEAISYTLAVTNAGPGCATAVEVLDLAPPGTQIVAITADNPSSDGEFCTLGGVCELGTLMPAGTGVSALSLANSTPGSADGSTFDRTVTVSPGDLPAGSTITDVDIAVEFEKIDGEVCAAGHQGGQAYNNEIVFYLTSPSGTRVVLVDNYLNWGGSALGDTYTDFATYGGHVTVAFDDAAATIVGASPNPEYPTSGHFQPVEALSTLNGESPFGTWTLTVGDAQAFDALCFSGFDLTMTAEDTAASAPATINLVLAVDPDYSEGTLVNEAQVSADQADPDETNNIASVTTPVTTSADLSIAKTVIKDEICLGSYGFYELVATNGGPSDAQNVVVSDTLPADLIFGGGSPECSEAAGVVTCNAGTLAAGASADFLIAFNIDPSVVDGTPITNTASVSSSTPDPGPLPNSDSAAFTAVQCFLPEADMSITKSMAPDPLNAGETIAVTLTVTNNGLHAAENVTVQDLFFFAEQVDAFNLPPGWFCDGGVTCIRSNPMPAGAVETLSFSIHIAPDRSPGLYDNQAYVTADNPDSDLADNLDAYSYQVNTDASLTIAKVGMPDPVIAGGTLLYQLTITNTGPSVAWDVVVTDTLPAGATFAQASPGCSEAAGVVTCQLGDLGVDAPQSVFIAVIVDDALPDGTLLTNQACVTGTSNTTDNTPICASDDTMVNQSPLNPTDLALSMTLLETDPVGPIYNGVPGADGYTVAGGYLETQIVVENTGAAPATDVVLFSQLPYRFTFVEAEFDYNYDPAGPFLCTQESCALGSIPAGEAVTITMSILVESNAPLSLQSWHYFHNHVLIQAANPDPNTLNNWDQVGVTVEPLVDMEISKITTLDSVVPGENVTYEISAFNYGPSDLSWSWSQWQFGNYDELHIWDRLPVEVDPATVLIEMGGYYTGYYCGVVSGFVSCMFDLPAYHAAVLRITGQVRPDVTESFTNTAYAEDYYGTFIISDTAVVTVTPQADLVLDKSAPANGNAGELLGYTLSVQNNGPSHARGVVITDTLPAGATFLYGDSSCVDTGGVVACTIGTLPDGASATRYFTVTLASDLESGISLENIAFVAADTPDPDLTNNTDDADTTILGRADLALDKTGPTTIVAGEPITYTLLVNNAGPSTAQAVILQDSLPSGVSFTSAEVSSSSGGSLLCASPICDLGDVAVGEVLTVTLVGAVDPSLLPGTILTNTASLTSSTLDDDPVDNTAQAETLVETAADLAIDKVDLSDPVEPTEGFLYQINIANPGPSDAQDVVVVDTLGDGLTFSAASPGCSGLAGSPTVTCTLSTLGAGEETFFLLAVRAGDVPSGTVLVNTATITSTTIDWLPENNSDIEYTTVKQLPGPSADLAITKTASPTTVTAGDLVTYTLTVTNAGPQEATGVQLLELIPLHTEMVSISADNPDFAYPFCTLSGICYLGTIQPFSTTVTVVAVLRVDPDCMEPSLTNTATVFADQADHHPENNLASAVVGVGPWFTADLALEKAATATVIPGGMITYTLTVWNLGPQTAANLVLTDTLPADVTLSWVDPACTQAGQAVICTAPSLDSGQTITFSLAATANPGLEAGTSVENLALVTSDAYDPNPANNIDTADTSIAGWTDLVLVSMTGPERVTPGGLVTYTIVVFNNGPDIARAVEVRDDFPPDFTQLAISVQRSGGLSIPCGGAVCLVGDMAVGETVTVTVVGQAGIAIPPSPWVTNQATVYSGTPEYDLDNNTASLPLWIGYRLYMPLIPTSRPNGP
ncbi:MAG: DUF11 domain-containing protein, partial [Anaerolineales bacterium]|nr:DUF11 domain-containing protein [Anaerolineales bacterium]